MYRLRVTWLRFKIDPPRSQCTGAIRLCRVFPTDGSSDVHIRGPEEAKQGDVVSLYCETGRSNPPSTIKWTVAAETEKNSTATVVAAPQSSWITKSNVSFAIPNGQRTVDVTCQAVSNSQFEKVAATHKINVLRE